MIICPFYCSYGIHKYSYAARRHHPVDPWPCLGLAQDSYGGALAAANRHDDFLHAAVSILASRRSCPCAGLGGSRDIRDAGRIDFRDIWGLSRG